MKFVVTGCAGFIGANFALYLLDNYPGDIVIGIDCLTYAANREALERLSRYSRFRFYKDNICDSEAIERILSTERPEVVVNFAAESHVDRSLLDSLPFFETNVRGTEVLLEASCRHGIKRFHQISTDEVYGDLPLDSAELFSEDSNLNPSSPYSQSKAEADVLALSYMKKYSLPVSISRSTNNYGIYQHEEKLIPMAIGRVVSGRPVPIYGDGSNMRDWLYVTDHCRAIDLIIRKGKCQIYNVGANNHWRNIDLVNRIIALSGYPDGEIVFVPDRKGHDRKYAVSCDRIKNELGWEPQAEFGDSLIKTIEWYKNR